MDKDLMNRALAQVLGEGYENNSRTSGVGESRTPSPHDFLQGRVSKSNPGGGDMHVPTTMGKLKAKKPSEERVAHGLLTAGAIGGTMSLPTLVKSTKSELRKGGILKPAPAHKAPSPNTVARTAAKVGEFKPVAAVTRVLGKPKVAAGIAGTAAGLEVAGLAGDFLGRKVTGKDHVKKSDEPLITFSKVDDEKQQVFGWFSVSKNADGEDVFDLQGDHIPIEETELADYDYMLNSRKGGNQHARVYSRLENGYLDDPKHVADIIESVVYTPEKIAVMGLPENFPQGWWGGMQIHDDETWAQIKRGERAGFSVHGKGRRRPVDEPVAKAARTRQQEIDRKEQIKDISLGTASAVAGTAGGTAALLPVAVKRGYVGAKKGERVGGRLKTVAGVVGGTAGVYGGLHSAHQAARQPMLKQLPARTMNHVREVRKDWAEFDAERSKRSQLNEAARHIAGRGYNNPEPKPVAVTRPWSPVVDRDAPEARRERRNKRYQNAALGTAGAAGLTSAGAHLSHRGHLAEAVTARGKAESIKVPGKGELKRRIAGSRSLRAGNDRYNAQNKIPVNPKQRAAAGEKAERGIRERFGAEQGNARTAKGVQEAAALKHTNMAAGARKLRGRAGLVALGGVAAAGAIQHQRNGSWRPYPNGR